MIRESVRPAKGFGPSAKAGPRKRLRVLERPAVAPRKGMSRAEERALVARAKSGDRAAQRRILEAVSGTVYRFGRSFCRNPHDAEDVTQDVLMKLLEALPGFRGESALSSWAFVVARRTCALRRRRAGRTTSLEERAGRAAWELPDPHASPATDAERGELRARLEAALHALPPAQREVVLLRDVEGRTAPEVARALGLNERAVKSRLHRARLALRRALGRDGDGAGAAPASRPAPPRRKSRCPETALLVSRYLEGDLSPGVCSALEAHVRDCPDCLRQCEALKAALGACRAWGQARPPRAVAGVVTAAIRRSAGAQRP